MLQPLSTVSWYRPKAPVQPLFGLNANKSKAYHRSDQQGDQYQRYNPANTNLPLALFHTVASPDAQRQHAHLGNQLALYIAGRGHKALGIPWVTERKPILDMDYTVFDVETTGLDQNARIIQLAAAAVNRGHKVDFANSLDQKFNPGLIEGSKRPFRVAPEAIAIHGITNEELQDQPQLSEWLSSLRANSQETLLGQKRLLVAYNAKFDVGRMNEAIRLYNQTNSRKISEIPLELVVDPFILMQRLHPFNSQKKTLGTVYKILMGCELENKHDAQADVDATVDVLKYTLKTLQKHAIPVQWCRITEGLLMAESRENRLKDADGKLVRWEQLDPVQKASLIAGYISRERPFFEERYPEYQAPPIRAIDVLNFQFGNMAVHDGPIAHYPVFDITLDKSGIHSRKYWDGTDRLDADIVREVRQEREQENVQYLVGEFKRNFPEFPLSALTKSFREYVKPKLKEEQEVRQFEQQLKNELLTTIGKRVAYKLMKRERPMPDKLEEANRQFLEEIKGPDLELIKALVEKKLAKYKDPEKQDAAPDLSRHYNALATQVREQTASLLTHVGNRYFYSHIDVDPKNAAQSGDLLIDPAVLKAYRYALRKADHNHILLHQNPDPNMRGKVLPTDPPVESGPAKSPYPVQKGLTVQQPWLDSILDGKKTWEIRGATTYHRGWVALAESGKNAEKGVRMIKGVAYLEDVRGPLTEQEIQNNTRKHKIPKAFLDFYQGVRYKKPYAWVLSRVHRLDVPIPVQAKQGQMGWFTLPEQAQKAVDKFLPPEIKKP